VYAHPRPPAAVLKSPPVAAAVNPSLPSALSQGVGGGGRERRGANSTEPP